MTEAFKVGQTVILQSGLWLGVRGRVAHVHATAVGAPGGGVTVVFVHFDGVKINRFFRFDEVRPLNIVERIGQLDEG